MIRLQLIGGGKMGEALLGGLLDRGWAAVDELHVVEPLPERRGQLVAAHPGLSVSDAPVSDADAVLAVKPDVVPVVLQPLAVAQPGRVLSIVAGVRTDAIEAGLAEAVAVVRCMPNTPALVGAGAAAVAAGSAASADDVDWAREILSAVGLVVEVEEADLDAVTGLSGSGPAYVFLLAEALTAAGIAQGLPAEIADALTRQTLTGAARLLAESGEDPAVLRHNVTSPGGTTAAGLAVFEEADFRGLIHRVVAAATARSAQLGGS